MKHTKKKISKIVDEMLTYFFVVGAEDIHVHVEDLEEEYMVTFSCNYDPDYRDRLERLDEILNSQPVRELEESYWELAGIGDMTEDSELHLIGMMVNFAQVSIGKERVELILHRNKE